MTTLAQLTGTEKQIKFANDIRNSVQPGIQAMHDLADKNYTEAMFDVHSEKFQKISAQFERLQNIIERLDNETSAKWWIENARNLTGEELINQMFRGRIK